MPCHARWPVCASSNDGISNCRTRLCHERGLARPTNDISTTAPVPSTPGGLSIVTVHHRCHCPASLAKLGPGACHCSIPSRESPFFFALFGHQPATWDPGSVVRSQSVLMAWHGIGFAGPNNWGKATENPFSSLSLLPALLPWSESSPFFMCFLFSSLPRWNRTFLF
jgi:hypothetical protein